jgi:putative FmdB family regulatory protein
MALWPRMSIFLACAGPGLRGFFGVCSEAFSQAVDGASPKALAKFLSFFLLGCIVPIYAYKCSACGHAQDVLQKMSDPLLTNCPQCQQETYVKQVTAAGFQLKGSGWYVTDFRNNGKGASTGGDAAGSGSGSGAASGSAAESGSAGATAAGSPASASSGSNAPAPAAAPAVAASTPAAPSAAG